MKYFLTALALLPGLNLGAAENKGAVNVTTNGVLQGGSVNFFDVNRLSLSNSLATTFAPSNSFYTLQGSVTTLTGTVSANTDAIALRLLSSDFDAFLLTLGTASEADIADFATAAQGAKADTAVQPGALATVATSGMYADLLGKPTLATVATSGAYTDLTGRPSLATVATSGSYVDLINKPTLAAVATSGAYADLTGKPSLSTVATSGAYNDLSGKPTLGTAASTDASAYATAAQGVKADGAAQKSANLSDLANTATARSNLGLSIGSAVQAWSSLLDSVAAIVTAGNAGKAITVNAGGNGFDLTSLGGGSGTLTGITNAGNSSFSLINNSNPPAPALKSISFSGYGVSGTDQGTNIVITSPTIPRMVGSRIIAITNTYSTTTTMVALTNSLFNTSQGTAVITNTYTPISTTNTLKFTISTYHSGSAATTLCGAIFDGSTTNSITGRQIGTVPSADYIMPIDWVSYAAPTSAGSPLDFVCRVGRNGGAATWTLNTQNTPKPNLGGQSKIIFTVEEWKDLNVTGL